MGSRGSGGRADSLQHLRRGVGNPLADCQQRPRPGQYRARGEREHDDQSVPYSARITRVGYFGQPFQQTRHVCGFGPWMAAELVKGGRDRR